MITLRKYNVCRLCLCASDRVMDIFEDNCGVEFSLPETLKDLLQIEVNCIVGLPWQICSCCLDKVADFRLFKRRCLESKVTFESRLQGAVHLLSSNVQASLQPSVVAVEEDSGKIHKGLLFPVGQKTVQGSGGCFEALSSSGALCTTGGSYGVAHVKKEKFTEDERLNDSGNKRAALIGGSKAVVKAEMVDGVSSHQTAEVDLCRVKGEPVQEVSSTQCDRAQDVSATLMDGGGTVLLRPACEMPCLLPLSEQQSALGEPLMESLPHKRRRRGPSPFSETVESFRVDCPEGHSTVNDSEDSSDETYIPEEITVEQTRVPFHIKKKVVAIALQHPNWSWSSLKCIAGLRSRDQLRRWKKQVLAALPQDTKRTRYSGRVERKS